MQRYEVNEGINFMMAVSTNAASLQLVGQVAVSKEAIEYNLTVYLNCSDDGLCGYSDVCTQIKQMGV